ncbi:MAG: glutamate synthase subunit alpha, partial [Alphaproteobacteria bacterium]|nr:glutamate synthase subunit alpha [Alphaproteobacteria bacterium]
MKIDRGPNAARGFPVRQGLYDSRNEHDSCGVGFVANIKGRKSHAIIEQGLQVLVNLTHRGAVGADPKAGDGAGILIQIPDAFYRPECAAAGFELPAAGDYGVGMIFMPADARLRGDCEAVLEKIIGQEGQTVLGWRDVPVDNSDLGASVKETEPHIRQIFVGRGENCADTEAFERKLFVVRKRIARDVAARGEAYNDFYIPSLSARTVVYKGMLLAHQVETYYRDLADDRVASALAMVHQRFSTNTFPTWKLAHPFRMICHNGEINTLRGNLNWMNARRHTMRSDLFGEDLDKVWPLIPEGQSDSACFDNALELLLRGGYSLAHAMMLLIPEAWHGNALMDSTRRAFYEYHAALMEPWDGPAAVAFTDGRQIGATLDRNGLRPARYLVTDDDTVLMSSEVGVLPVAENRIIKKWRLQPGKMLLIDLDEGRIIDDAEIKADLGRAQPYQQWLDATQIVLEDLPATGAGAERANAPLLDRQQAFGYTQEDLKLLMAPMASTGQEAVGSMGADTPIAALSSQPKLLYAYFKQLFAQVTNPPIDPIREELVMSLVSLIGPRPNLLGLDTTGSHRRLEVKQPILTNEDLEKIRSISDFAQNAFKTVTLDLTYPVEDAVAGMKTRLAGLCREAEAACGEGYNIIILSDRKISDLRIAIPALLGTSAVHHHLIREGLRTSLGLVVETGEAREVHHYCLLAGYGAEAINPYLAFETLADMRGDQLAGLARDEVQERYIKAVDKGILKVMSKMGISTYQSYCGAQIFDAVGLASSFVDEHFF